MTRKTINSDATAYYNPDNQDDPWMPKHERVCPFCQKSFRTFTKRTVYCSLSCARKQNCQQWRANHPDSYANHKERMRLHQQAKRILAQADKLKRGK